MVAARYFVVGYEMSCPRVGTNHFDNLHMVRGHSKRLKEDREQAYFMARLRET